MTYCTVLQNVQVTDYSSTLQSALLPSPAGPVNDYSIQLYQSSAASELQVAVFSVSLCQPVYAEVSSFCFQQTLY